MSVVFADADGGSAVETLVLAGAYCVSYHEQFVRGDTNEGAYVCHLVLSDPAGFTIQAGGPAAAFVAPAAREHGVTGPPVGIGGALGVAPMPPIIVDAEGVPRLPLIEGDPPFHCKGPKKGKLGLDPVEFERQLKGQQHGLNQLTVAEFIANRDQYDALRKQNKLLNKKGGGRDPKGDAVQKIAREKAFQDKV